MEEQAQPQGPSEAGEEGGYAAWKELKRRKRNESEARAVVEELRGYIVLEHKGARYEVRFGPFRRLL